MSAITNEFLKKVAPAISTRLRSEYEVWLNIYCFQYEINNELRLSAFFANLMEESARMTRLTENLNYSAKRLMQIWPRRFPTLAIANKYAHNEIALANYVYNGRLGNVLGSNDGWIFRGGGLFQTTGRSNYEMVGKELALDLIKHPELLRTPRYAVQSACYEFQHRGCNKLADLRKLTMIVEKINGGHNGLAHRLEFFNLCMSWLPDGFALTAPPEYGNRFDAAFQATPFKIKDSDAPDTAKQPDAGTPSYITTGDQESFVTDENPDTTPVEPVSDAPKPIASIPKENVSESPQTPAIAPSVPPVTPEIPKSVSIGQTTVEVKGERPSTFVRWLSAMMSFFGLCITTLSSYCGGTDVQSKIANKVIENADRTFIEELAIIVIYSVIGIGAGVFLIYVASKFYDNSAKRANDRTLVKMNSAMRQDVPTIEME